MKYTKYSMETDGKFPSSYGLDELRRAQEGSGPEFNRLGEYDSTERMDWTEMQPIGWTPEDNYNYENDENGSIEFKNTDEFKELTKNLSSREKEEVRRAIQSVRPFSREQLEELLRPYSAVEGDYSKDNEMFGQRTLEAKKTSQFFENVVLLESECSNSGFIRYLQSKQGFRLVPTEINEFEVSYLAPRIVTDEGIAVRPAREFKTTDGMIADPEEVNTIVEDIRSHYDTYRSEVLR